MRATTHAYSVFPFFEIYEHGLEVVTGDVVVFHEYSFKKIQTDYFKNCVFFWVNYM